jgi:hypothetical protein
LNIAARVSTPIVRSELFAITAANASPSLLTLVVGQQT